jgi:hypothetical protein
MPRKTHANAHLPLDARAEVCYDRRVMAQRYHAWFAFIAPARELAEHTHA